MQTDIILSITVSIILLIIGILTFILYIHSASITGRAKLIKIVKTAFMGFMYGAVSISLNVFTEVHYTVKAVLIIPLIIALVWSVKDIYKIIHAAKVEVEVRKKREKQLWDKVFK